MSDQYYAPSTSHRQVLKVGAAALAAGTIAGIVPGNNVAQAATSAPTKEGKTEMTSFTTLDGTEIFYKDWGTGQPIVFHHGWPLISDDWDAQMLFFVSKGYRVIAHDRRGHGRSTQTTIGNDMDTYAQDVAALVAHLKLKDAVHIGHSTGGGEVARYVAQHGAGLRALYVEKVSMMLATSTIGSSRLAYISYL